MKLYLMFILFFGTRPGKAKESVLPGVPCPYCSQLGQLKASIQNRYVHIFWIPVYRLSPSTFVRCGHCKKGYNKGDCSPEMQEAIKKLDKE